MSFNENFINDTIAAVSTPLGAGGISVIRVCGENALSAADKIFKAKNGKSLLSAKSHTVVYGNIVDGDDVVDEVLCTVMLAPKSYTCEDTVEINCHGGIVVTRRILSLILTNGARRAEPGEFTKRAFLNGRLDLSQAEAVIDLINAKTELAQKSAAAELSGGIRKAVSALRERLLDIIAEIEVTIDYPEHELDERGAQNIADRINDIMLETEKLIASADRGKILKNGINAAIIGAPNVGKSSLLNCLLKEERAIVTDIPGTTRDVIEEYVDIGGVALKLADTAGVRETEDVVEKIGVERSVKRAENAELILLLIDGSRELSDDDKELLDFVKQKKAIVVINKSDLEQKTDTEYISARVDKGYILHTSAKRTTGIDELCDLVKKLFMLGDIEQNCETAMGNERHKTELTLAYNALETAKNSASDMLAEDFISMDLQQANEHFAKITGDAADEEIIDRIFSKFCLGK